MVSRMFKLGFLNKLSKSLGLLSMDRKKAGKILQTFNGPGLGPKPTFMDQLKYFFDEATKPKYLKGEAKKAKEGLEAIKGKRIPIK